MNNELNQKHEYFITPLVLEKICRDIGEMDSGYNLRSFLKSCGVSDGRIVYPESKWKMVYKALEFYNISTPFSDPKPLYTVIETACHPVMHGGNKRAANYAKEKFNAILDYDGSYINDSGNLLLVNKLEDGFKSWMDKFGNEFEPSVSVIFPNELAVIFVFWKRVIGLARLYDNFSEITYLDENTLDELYLEAIHLIENTLNKGHCGNLGQIYKRPFSLISAMGSEESKGKIFGNLYRFLSMIDKTYPSNQMVEFIDGVKSENKKLISKIDTYICKAEARQYKSDIPSDTPSKEIVSRPLEVVFKSPLDIGKLPNIYTESNTKEQRIYWFDDKIFKLRLSNNEVVSIPFYKNKKSNKSDPFCLMTAICELLETKGNVVEKDSIKWLSVFVTEEELMDKVNLEYTPQGNWLRYTKNNLNKLIPEKHKGCFIISNYMSSGSKSGYEFAFKYPF